MPHIRIGERFLGHRPRVLRCKGEGRSFTRILLGLSKPVISTRWSLKAKWEPDGGRYLIGWGGPCSSFRTSPNFDELSLRSLNFLRPCCQATSSAHVLVCT